MTTPLKSISDQSSPGDVIAAGIAMSIALFIIIAPFVAVALTLGWNYGLSHLVEASVGWNTSHINVLEGFFCVLGLAALRPIHTAVKVA